MPAESFDVFLSHNSKDKPAVERLAERLRDDGFEVWLDKWNLVPGTPFQDAIEQALPACRCCAFFVGPDGIGPWHRLEMRVALNQQIASGRDFRVIPVLMPDAPQPDRENLPLFLHELTWVQFGAEDDADAYHRLSCGIRGEAPGFTPAKVDQPAVDDPTLKIVPRGLRSFDAEDDRFFLRLLPGPRDHRGLPVGVAFWKDRLEQIDPERTFSVGLIYGPSGCGKTSLVKAGLLPRLAEYVKPIYLEATPADTERQLLAGLKRRFSALPADLDLADSFRYAVDHPEALEGHKVVVILDQFEQWLHANRPDADCPLVAALRQCDGTHVQCVLMVRADFFLGIHRLMAVAESPIRQDRNMALVDLFDPPHARHVLAEFGRAYGCLPDDLDQLSEPQSAFVDQAVSELADRDQKLVAVHLALFADMVRSKPWTPATLKTVGGAAGVGRTFLEENFDHRTANPAHRVHRQAAMAVLSKLLPEPGADIKGAMQSRDALRKASGYEQRPDGFDELMRILVNELRIVSPAAAEAEAEHPGEPTANEDCYQLTHDYLVSSLREWLTARQKDTWRGRAQLKLEERAAQWGRDPKIRYLPNPVEFASISLGVPRKKQTVEQRKMMRVARAWYAVGVAVLFVLGVAGGWYANDTRDKHVEVLVSRVLEASPEGLPYAVRDLHAFRSRAIPKLQRETAEEIGRRRLHAAWALAALGEVDQNVLLDEIALVTEQEVRDLVRFLRPEQESVLEQLNARFEKAKSPEQKARYATVALHLGDICPAVALLALGKDPTNRTAFIHGFPTWHGNLEGVLPVMEKLDVSKPEDAGVRSGLCSALGLVADAKTDPAQSDLAQIVTGWYEHAPDAPTHSAAGWLLRRWDENEPEIEPSAMPHDGDWFVNSVRMTLVRVPAGEFQMGSDDGDEDERPPHPVKLTRDFFLSDREVTVGLFQRFVNEANQDDEIPDDEKPGDWSGALERVSPTDDCPVQEVTWYDAVKFCNWLSLQDDRTPCYTFVKDATSGEGQWHCEFDISKADGCRLPTEAEWEYACRARAETKFCFGSESRLLGEYATFYGNSDSKTTPVGQRLPNGFGLFDVHGNVWEWCWDWHEDYQPTETPVPDPPGPAEGHFRVLRGGSWNLNPGLCRVADRYWFLPVNRLGNLGFRVLCVVGSRT